MGVNIDSDFLSLVEGFLHCWIGSIPFIYLGLPVGCQPEERENLGAVNSTYFK